MRVEFQDEASTLRVERTEIRCVHVLHVRVTTVSCPTAPVPPRSHETVKLRECHDCGRCVVTCRCAPGEG